MLAMLKYVPGVLTKKISMQELRPLLNAEVAPYITKLSVHKMGVSNCLLYDGFFSFAVVWQSIIQYLIQCFQ